MCLIMTNYLLPSIPNTCWFCKLNLFQNIWYFKKINIFNSYFFSKYFFCGHNNNLIKQAWAKMISLILLLYLLIWYIMAHTNYYIKIEEWDTFIKWCYIKSNFEFKIYEFVFEVYRFSSDLSNLKYMTNYLIIKHK